jgi:predicted HD phosphohydrolase
MRYSHPLTQLSRFTDWPIARHAAVHSHQRQVDQDLASKMSGWPNTTDDLVDWMLANGERELPGHAVPLQAHARAAATLARRDGACDTLIAAAALHKLPGLAEEHSHDQFAPPPMVWLRTLFPDAVLGPIRLMPAARAWLAMGDSPSVHHEFLDQSHALRALRLCGFEDAAYQPEAIGSALPWSALRPVLQRCAL